MSKIGEIWYNSKHDTYVLVKPPKNESDHIWWKSLWGKTWSLGFNGCHNTDTFNKEFALYTSSDTCFTCWSKNPCKRREVECHRCRK